MNTKKYSIYGVENPLMDFLVYVDDDFLKSTGAPKGSSGLINIRQKEDLVSKLTDYVNIPGGSCANTIRGIAWLSKFSPIEPALYGGAVGNDSVGENYIKLMKEDYSVIPRIPQKSKSTGVSIVLVTPDCERTMFTYLGACEDYSSMDVDLDAVKNANIFHTTGYMWSQKNTRQAMEKAIEHARSHGTLVSFDLADPFVVKFNREAFLEYLPQRADFLFGNKDEIQMMLGESGEDEETARKAGKLAKTVIIKVGPRGCFVNDRGRIVYVAGKKVDAVDTVGAGDSFAAGFLFGILKNMEIPACAEIANNLASSIVTVSGCNYFKLDQKKVLEKYQI